ncbi:hypothetical protein TNCV_634691 [Trichonephila clavipes]|nr:hypothetical protein TNCV_634691 [Trichonephila clavipes]
MALGGSLLQINLGVRVPVRLECSRQNEIPSTGSHCVRAQVPLSGEESAHQNYLWQLVHYLYGASLKSDTRECTRSAMVMPVRSPIGEDVSYLSKVTKVAKRASPQSSPSVTAVLKLWSADH